jgi:hypothetical protein
MIRLTASDIVRRAMQLADIEGSDFISWNENINLLNEAYMKTFQQAINKGEKFYICTVDIATTGGSIEKPCYITLPDDFFQLESLVTLYNGAPIQRRSVNQPPANVCYDIEGDTLAIYGTVSQGLRLRYYPAPHTLTFPAANVSANTGDNNVNNRCDVYGENYVIVDDGAVSIYHGKTGTTDLSGLTASYAIAGKNAIALQNVDGWHVYTWKFSQLNDGEAVDFLILDAEKNILIADATAHTAVNPRTGQTVRTLPEDMQSMGAIDESGALYFISDGVLMKQDSEDSTPYAFVQDIAFNSCRYLMAKGGNCFILDSGNVARCNADGYTYLDGEYYAISKLDENTGYGFLTFDIDSGFQFSSWIEDTALDYPSNLFIQILAYTLAMAYKTKQNADATALASLYDEALMQYYDTLSRDAYAPVRIQNVMR